VTGTVKLLSLFMKISVDSNSFQLAVRANSAMVTIPRGRFGQTALLNRHLGM
jgi:hypothetical protein